MFLKLLSVLNQNKLSITPAQSSRWRAYATSEQVHSPGDSLNIVINSKLNMNYLDKSRPAEGGVSVLLTRARQ